MAPQTMKLTFLAFAVLLFTALVQGLRAVSESDTSAVTLTLDGLVARNITAREAAQGTAQCVNNNTPGLCQFRTDMYYSTQLYEAYIFGWDCQPLSEQCQGDLGTPNACGSILPNDLTIYSDPNIWVHATAANYEGNWAYNLNCVNDDNNYAWSSCFAWFDCEFGT